MTTLRWAAFLIGAESLICLLFTRNGVWSTILAALFLLCFLIVGSGHSTSTSTDSRKANQP